MTPPRCKLRGHARILVLAVNLFFCLQLYRHVLNNTTQQIIDDEPREADELEARRREWRRHQAASDNGTEWWLPWARQYKKAHPYSGDPHSPVVIGSWGEKQPGKDKWYEDEDFSQCPALYPWMKCVYKHAQSLQDLARSDAILFHARHLCNESDLPSFARPPHQKWIFYETEPPTNVWNRGVRPDWAGVWDKFNLSATYTTDSDVTNHNHHFKCFRVTNGNEEETPRVSRHKKRAVAWFVSHCETPSLRELYVEELRKYIEVDVFGRCGRSMCDQFPSHTAASIKCLRQFINSTYKFYLSFENSFCREYITEKLHLYVNLDVVPIVLGSYDYASLLPPGTYIDVRNFTSPRALANYVRTVDDNDDLYDAYIARKRRYRCERRVYRRFRCVLCEYLHTERLRRQTLADPAAFWSERRQCSSPRDFYRNVADDVISRMDQSPTDGASPAL